MDSEYVIYKILIKTIVRHQYHKLERNRWELYLQVSQVNP